MTAQHGGTVRPCLTRNQKFDSFVDFKKFLAALLTIPIKLSKMKSPNDIKSFSEHNLLRPFQQVCMNDHFVNCWNILYSKCSTERRPGKSTKAEAKVIEHALTTRPDLMTLFNDFPRPPVTPGDSDDKKKYIGAIQTLKMKNCDFYSDIQRDFMDFCIWTARTNTSLFYLQSKRNSVNKGHTTCLDLKWHIMSASLFSANVNDYQILHKEPTEADDFVQLAYIDRCEYQEETVNKQATLNESTVVGTSSIPTNLSICSVEPQIVGQAQSANDSLRTSGVKRRAGTTNNAGPEPKKRCESSTGTNDPSKFDTFLRFNAFLRVLLKKFKDDLSQLTTPKEIKKLADRPKMKPFQDILLNKHFARRWRLLYEKCDPVNKILKKSVKDAAREIQLKLESKGSLLKQFAEFPVKAGDGMKDVKRYFDQLSAMLKQKTSYNKAQQAYIRGRLSDAKKLLQQLEMNGNSSNVPVKFSGCQVLDLKLKFIPQIQTGN